MTAAAADLERVLDALLHDLRSPMGVAGGYLRLLREGRLPNPDDSDKAIGKAQDALRAMTALCAEAAEWLKEPPSETEVVVTAGDLLARIAAQADSAGVSLDVIEGDSARTLTLRLEPERVAATVIAILRTAIGDATGRCTARLAGDVLELMAIVPDRRGPTEPGIFDPWAYPGMSTALSCRRLEQAGGRCRRGGAEGEVVRVEFDVTA